MYEKLLDILLSATLISFAVICICFAILTVMGVGMMIASAF